MAKKLTKAQIAKNPTKAINSGKMKMKKQEVPFGGIGRAAARVVGKAIVNATTGKTAARKYAESKARSDASKASIRAALKTAKKSKPLAKPKSAVRVKPAAKQRPNKPDAAKANYKASDGGYRAYNKAAKEYEQGAGKYGNMYEQQDAAREAMFRAPIGRKTSIQGRKLNEAEARKATTPVVKGPATWSTKTPIKINTDPTKPKGVFGPLKKKIAAKSPKGRANVKANARGLKAANKKVSNKNSGIGGATVSAIIKRAEPARANRTRLGKNAFKSK